jgi:hypothetical protein
MAASVPRQEYNRLAVEFTKAEFVRGAAERALDMPPFDIGEAVDVVKPAAADNADDPPPRSAQLRHADKFLCRSLTRQSWMG